MIEEIIKNWFETSMLDSRKEQNRSEVLLSLFIVLKAEKIKSGDINESVAQLILDNITVENLPDTARVQLQTLMILDIDLARRAILGSPSGFAETEYVAPVVSTALPRAPRSDDVELMDESESIKIDKNLLKNKEYDLELLKTLGIDIRDLDNE